MTTLSREELLILLIEECSEVIQAATKALRFGFDVDHGIGYGNNKEVLAREYGDLHACAQALGISHGPQFTDAWLTKLRRAEKAKETYGVKP